MSLAAMQTALAALIRCPKDNRGQDLRSFLAPYDLTQDEYGVITTLAAHPELNKYGLEQAYQRWELLQRHIVRLFRFVDEEILETLWFDYFEPKAMTVASDHAGGYDYSRAFLHFLANDATAFAKVRQASYPFIKDLLFFEMAELSLRCPLPTGAPLLTDSPISFPYFRIVSLNYDIAAIIQQGLKARRKLPQVMYLVFVHQGGRSDPRVFEITAATAAYLLGEIGQGERGTLSAAMAADLASLGLCRKDKAKEKPGK